MVRRKIDVEWRWLVGPPQGGPVCFYIPWIVGCVTTVVCLCMFENLLWFCVEGGRLRLQGYQIRILV